MNEKEFLKKVKSFKTEIELNELIEKVKNDYSLSKNEFVKFLLRRELLKNDFSLWVSCITLLFSAGTLIFSIYLLNVNCIFNTVFLIIFSIIMLVLAIYLICKFVCRFIYKDKYMKYEEALLLLEAEDNK